MGASQPRADVQLNLEASWFCDVVEPQGALFSPSTAYSTSPVPDIKCSSGCRSGKQTVFSRSACRAALPQPSSSAVQASQNHAHSKSLGRLMLEGEMASASYLASTLLLGGRRCRYVVLNLSSLVLCRLGQPELVNHLLCRSTPLQTCAGGFDVLCLCAASCALCCSRCCAGNICQFLWLSPHHTSVCALGRCRMGLSSRLLSSGENYAPQYFLRCQPAAAGQAAATAMFLLYTALKLQAVERPAYVQPDSAAPLTQERVMPDSHEKISAV